MVWACDKNDKQKRSIKQLFGRELLARPSGRETIPYDYEKGPNIYEKVKNYKMKQLENELMLHFNSRLSVTLDSLFLEEVTSSFVN